LVEGWCRLENDVIAEERGHVSGVMSPREFGGAAVRAVGGGESGEKRLRRYMTSDSKKDGVVVGVDKKNQELEELVCGGGS